MKRDRRPAAFLLLAGIMAGAGCAAPTDIASPTGAAISTTRSTPSVAETTPAPGEPAQHPGTDPATVPAAGRPGTALAVLNQLPVKGRAPKTGYDRDQFGQAWADTDRNGCDTRNDTLRRDLTDLTIKPGTRGCVVLTGRLADPYTGQQVQFERGGASEVDIDHVVALGDAWQKGAQQWPTRERLAFANDPLNLLAVEAAANRAKGDSDAATWLPPARPYRCVYVARQVGVKAKYELWVTAAEKATIARVLSACPDQRAATGDAPTLAPIQATLPARARTSHPAASTAVRSADPNVSYANCAEADAAGVTPLRRGQPGYAAHLDRDGDGIACE